MPKLPSPNAVSAFGRRAGHQDKSLVGEVGILGPAAPGALIARTRWRARDAPAQCRRLAHAPEALGVKCLTPVLRFGEPVAELPLRNRQDNAIELPDEHFGGDCDHINAEAERSFDLG